MIQYKKYVFIVSLLEKRIVIIRCLVCLKKVRLIKVYLQPAQFFFANYFWGRFTKQFFIKIRNYFLWFWQREQFILKSFGSNSSVTEWSYQFWTWVLSTDCLLLDRISYIIKSKFFMPYVSFVIEEIDRQNDE